MSGGAAVVEVENLVRDYVTGGARGAARRVRALNGVSLAVPRGTLFGLLGPNGAGKTTMVKVLTTVITPTAGSARVFGFDVVREAHRIRPRLGVAYGGELGLYWRLNGLDNLVFAGQLQGMGPKEARARAWALLERFGLAGAARQRVDGYSRGMRQRLHLARCLMHDPELLFLDEPTTGLDPAAARDVRQLILELKAAGKTVFLTTHNMGEADSLCDRVAILARGALVTVGSPAE
ncbi:MAG: ABC transporter ATP-binding protein, partial [Bacillota bacterium]